MKQILKERDDIVFFIKLFPLKIHPAAYEKSKAVVCEKSLELLDDAFAGKNIPKAKCETKELDENAEVAQRLGISGTPAIILPDGAIIPGFKDAASLIELITKSKDNNKPAEPAKE